MRHLLPLLAIAVACVATVLPQAQAKTELRPGPGRLHMGQSAVTVRISCFVSSSHGGSRISVRNSTQFILPAGARIDWRGKGGSGTMALATPLHPGHMLTTPDVHAVTDRCEAFVTLPESPGMSQ